ncbi:unnamed protein product, partial [Prorocentrum cordatum]
GKDSNPWKEPQTSTHSVPELLRMALKGTEDPTLMQAFEAQVLKRATSVFKDADHKHTQAAANVVRLKSNLEQARANEKSAALALAQGERAKKSAAEALALAEGISMQGADPSARPKFAVSWDRELDGIEELECEAAERAILRMIRSDLEGLATLMTTNEAEAEVTAMLANSQEVQSFADRFNKQRKVQQAQLAGEEHDQEFTDAAERLPQPKRESQLKALAEQNADTKGSSLGKGKGTSATAGKGDGAQVAKAQAARANEGCEWALAKSHLQAQSALSE